MKPTLIPQRALPVLGAIALAATLHSMPAVAAAPAPADLQAPVVDFAGDALLRPEIAADATGKVRLSYGGIATDLPAVFELNHEGQWTVPATVIKDAPAGGPEMIVDPSETGVLMLRAGNKSLIAYTDGLRAAVPGQDKS
jgi:hypothetical protein